MLTFAEILPIVILVALVVLCRGAPWRLVFDFLIVAELLMVLIGAPTLKLLL